MNPLHVAVFLLRLHLRAHVYISRVHAYTDTRVREYGRIRKATRTHPRVIRLLFPVAFHGDVRARNRSVFCSLADGRTAREGRRYCRQTWKICVWHGLIINSLSRRVAISRLVRNTIASPHDKLLQVHCDRENLGRSTRRVYMRSGEYVYQTICFKKLWRFRRQLKKKISKLLNPIKILIFTYNTHDYTYKVQ